MKRYGGVEVLTHEFFTFVLDESEWLVPHFGCIAPGETASGTRCVGGWVDLRAQRMYKELFLCYHAVNF